MKLKKIQITYNELDGWPNYSNHSSTVVLDLDMSAEDLTAGLAELEKKIDGAATICEKAVARSIERTNARRPEPKGNSSGNGHANGQVAATAPPPAAAAPPATGPPPSNRVFGPPTNASTFAGWIGHEGSIYREQATKLCRELNYPTYFKHLTDPQAVYLYGQLYGNGQNGSTR